MIKKIPNIISTLRIVLSLLILAVKPFGLSFFVLYMLCGISDVLDGWIARKFDLVSRQGQLLDSIADTVMVAILLFIFFSSFYLPLHFIYWIAIICICRLSSFIVGFIKYCQLAFLHTYANKITGVLLFCLPILYHIIGLNATLIILCFVASASSIEELIINATSKKLQRDIKSLFMTF